MQLVNALLREREREREREKEFAELRLVDRYCTLGIMLSFRGAASHGLPCSRKGNILFWCCPNLGLPEGYGPAVSECQRPR